VYADSRRKTPPMCIHAQSAWTCASDKKEYAYVSHDSYCADCDGPCQLLRGIKDPVVLWERYVETQTD
jgi:hypothetical protein